MSDNNMNTILGMLDHVNELSDAEISHFINDKEARACYETIVLVRQAFHSSTDTSLYSQGRTSSILNYPFSIFNSKRIAAALIILLIMVATLGFAAFHFFGRSAPSEPQSIELSPTEQTTTTETNKEKELTGTPVVFENETLQTILSKMANHYDVSIEYEQEDIKDMRLYFNWDPSDSLEGVVNRLNNFDHLQIQQNGKTVVVKK